MNWEHKALKFYRETAGQGIDKSARQLLSDGIALLHSLAAADAVLLLRFEDAFTAKVEKSIPSAWEKQVINPDPVKAILAEATDNIVLWKELPEKVPGLGEMLKGMSTATMLHFNNHGNNAAILLAWKDPQQWDASFRDFLGDVHRRIDELLWQAGIKMDLEKVFTRFNAILQTVPQAVVFLDNSGTGGWINPQAAALLQLPQAGEQQPSILAGAMATLCNKARNSEEINAKAMQLFTDKNSAINDWIWEYEEPEKHMLDVSCVPLVSENVEGRLWVFDDVTSLYLINRQLQELNLKLEEETARAEAASRAKSEFLANMSHELRTPLNSMLVLSEILGENRPKNLTDKQLECARVIHRSGTDLLDLISDILDYSKVEAGRMELYVEDVLTAEIEHKLHVMFEGMAQRKQISFETIRSAECPMQIRTDQQRVEQIVKNFLSNAFKFTPAGGSISLNIYPIKDLSAIRRKSIHKSSGALAFSITDSGIGIPEDKQSLIFEAFRQVDGSTSRKFGGTGLGLAISREFADLLGREIHVESSEGKGSTFTLIVPFELNID